jgi:alkenylglycerophosphocholine/alkenylglycerophosphoethanolamine hydrolase
MYTYPYVLIFLGALALTLFLIARDRKGSVKALLYKTITSFLFISVAFASFMANQGKGVPEFAMLIMMGLVCGLIGDILLDLKVMYKESSSLYQHGGMVAFLVGHLFYLAALIIYFGFNWMPVVIALALAIIIAGVSKFILKFNFAEHSINTYAYSFVLSYMMTQACYAAITQGFTACTALLAAGSILFLLSDLVLVMTYYDNKDSRPFIVVNHVLYYAAEFSIALSILYLVV